VIRTLVRQPQKLPLVLTPGEVARLIEGRAAPSTRPRSRSLTALDCALSEVANLLCRTSTPSVIRVWEDPQIESAIKVKVNDLALPSEVREANNVNGLRKGLGKKRVIEVQGVSDRAPKPCSQGGQARGRTCRTRRRQFANGLGGAIDWPVRPRANWPRSVPTSTHRWERFQLRGAPKVTHVVARGALASRTPSLI
jgi:hypothetical protein